MHAKRVFHNIFFKFQLSSSCTFRYIRGRKITLGGAAPPGCLLTEKQFYNQSDYFAISNRVFNFNFVVLVVSDKLGGAKYTLVGPVPQEAPSEKLLTHAQVLAYIYIIYKFSASQLH